MGRDDRGLAFAGRLLIAIIFLVAGTGKLLGYATTVAYFAKLGIPMPEIATAVSIVVELGGGLAFLFGFQLVIVSTIMALFTIAAAFAAHRFWDVTDPAAHMAQMNNFLKNVAMCGGFIMTIVDARRMRAGRRST